MERCLHTCPCDSRSIYQYSQRSTSMFGFSSPGRSRVKYQMPLLRLFSSLLVFSLLLVPSGAFAAPASAPHSQTSSCQLNSAQSNIQHVIYIQFDNTHFLRDNANVPSDLEQMPHLLNFITGNGTLMANDHTALISHTATGILTSLTGVYPDRMGQPVSNSFRYFKTDGTTRTGVSFAYWTAPLFDPAGSP